MVDERDSVFDVPDGEDWQDGPKDLLAHQRRRKRGVKDNGWL